MSQEQLLGARLLDRERCSFRVWAPRARQVAVHLLDEPERVEALVPESFGYHAGVVSGVRAGTRYLFRLDGDTERPDPASRSQPEGVHGPSEVVATDFAWQANNWHGLALDDFVLYELHVGAFTPEGTFDAVAPRLDALRELGVTAVELMPVAQFPGRRNWGYDVAYPFAVQASYGGPAGLKRLVDACHASGLAIVLDVVYNHLGPEGNYLGVFAPYFTERYKTPWGQALNFDGPHSDEVRRYFIENALQWLDEYRCDALRLDAIHGICDASADPFLAQLQSAVARYGRETGRQVYLIAESDLNDTRVIRPLEQGGMNLPAQWNDDFHHAVHALLTGERSGYYADFGRLEDLATAYNNAFVYASRYSSFRQRTHGNVSRDLEPRQFVVFAQNHDQVGNRLGSERLSQLVDLEAQKLAAAAVILSPYLPLLFMGEEYGERAPFQYFVDFGDLALAEAVRRGRAAEFANFAWQGDPPDPQSESTFAASRPDWESRNRPPHRQLLEWYRELLRLRREHPALRDRSRQACRAAVDEASPTVLVRRGSDALTLLHFGRASATLGAPLPEGEWIVLADSASGRWGGPGSAVPERLAGGEHCTLSPWSCVLLVRASI